MASAMLAPPARLAVMAEAVVSPAPTGSVGPKTRIPGTWCTERPSYAMIPRSLRVMITSLPVRAQIWLAYPVSSSTVTAWLITRSSPQSRAASAAFSLKIIPR